MAIIGKPDLKVPLNPLSTTGVPSMELPSFRYLLSQERKTTKNVLIRTPFALGDCVCAEPAIRYVAKNFVGCDISIVTPFPELYRHIPLKKAYNPNVEKPDWDKYYVLECYHSADALQSEFVHNFNMAIEDYIAVCLIKGQLPVTDRNIILEPTEIERKSIPPQQVVIHAGKHWVSKSFPKWWWDNVIVELVAKGVQPTLIGADMEGGKRGTVDVDTTGCLDLRNKLSVMQSVAVLQDAQVVLSNDSAPYHMAASGDAWIGVLSTVRHFDFIGHWRSVEQEFGGHNLWNFKTENLALGQMWKNSDTSPAKNGAKYDVIDQATLISWLPEPEQVVEWTMGKLK